jgi:hypothetical protein
LANQDYSKEAQLLLPRRTSVFKELRPGTRPRAAAPPASGPPPGASGGDPQGRPNGRFRRRTTGVPFSGTTCKPNESCPRRQGRPPSAFERPRDDEAAPMSDAAGGARCAGIAMSLGLSLRPALSAAEGPTM